MESFLNNSIYVFAALLVFIVMMFLTIRLISGKNTTEILSEMWNDFFGKF